MSRKKRPYRVTEGGKRVHKSECLALNIDGRIESALTLGEARTLLEDHGYERCKVCRPFILVST